MNYENENWEGVGMFTKSSISEFVCLFLTRSPTFHANSFNTLSDNFRAYIRDHLVLQITRQVDTMMCDILYRKCLELPSNTSKSDNILHTGGWSGL